MKKFLIIVICIIFLYGMLPSVQDFVQKTLESLKDHVYSKDVFFSGAFLAREKSLLKLLPTETSVLHWHFNKDEITKALEEHPLIESASFAFCNSRSWNCFNLHIKEKYPTAVVALRDSFWALDENGIFLAPLEKRHREQLSELPLIEGVELVNSSPDFVKGRTVYAVKGVLFIEENSGYKIEKISVDANGEFKVKFKIFNFIATFGGNGELDFSKIKEELLRFKELLAYFVGNEAHIKELDFAYNSQCVVKLTEKGQKIMKDFKGESAVRK